MARKQYWGLTVTRRIEKGILIGMQLDGNFDISANKAGEVTKIHLFNPGCILDITEEKTIPKKFKRYVAGWTKERVNITLEVAAYLIKIEKKCKKK